MTKNTMAVELNQTELAAIIVEAMVELERPAGMSARDGLLALPESIRNDALRAAAAAMKYFLAQMQAAATNNGKITVERTHAADISAAVQ